MCRTWKGIKWVDESSFIAWVSGLDVTNNNLMGTNGGWFEVPQCSALYKWFIFWLYNCKNWDSFYTEIRNCIWECTEKDWIKRKSGDAIPHINLATIGMEKYAVTSLVGVVLGNSWIKAIGVSVITLITSYLITTYALKEIRTTVVELRYVPQEVSLR